MRNLSIRISDKFSEYGLYAIIFFIPISNAGIESFFGFALLGFTVKKILKPDFAFLKTKLNFFAALFLFFNALSLLNSGPYMVKSLKALIFKWLEYVLIFLIAEDILSNPKRFKNAMKVLLFGAALIGIDGLFQRLTGTDFLRHKTLFMIEKKWIGVTASFNHYNSLGAYLTIVLPLTVSLMIFLARRASRLIQAALAILLGFCLLMTSSRGSWIGFIAAMALMFFLSPKRKKILLLLAGFIVVITSVQLLRERSIFTFQPRGDTDRLIMWNTAIRMIKENPLIGKGVGTYMDYFHKYAPTMNVQYAHNCYLQLWAEIGIFGLLSFILFAGSILTKGIKTLGKTKDPFLLGTICGLFGFLFHSFFDTNLYGVQLSVLFWMSAGIITARLNYGVLAE